MAGRISSGVTRPAAITIWVDDVRLEAFPGETVAGAMAAAGLKRFYNAKSGAPREALCQMGVCFECTVIVADEGEGERDAKKNWVRACITQVRPGMRILTRRWAQSDVE